MTLPLVAMCERRASASAGRRLPVDGAVSGTRRGPAVRQDVSRVRGTAARIHRPGFQPDASFQATELVRRAYLQTGKERCVEAAQSVDEAVLGQTPQRDGFVD